MKKIITCVILAILLSMYCNNKSQTEDKAGVIALFIESKVNIGGYSGCETRVISPGNPGIIQCDLHWPAGTNSSTVKANTKGIADVFAQAGRLAATIYYTGYSGNQKVCEYQYDPYSGTVEKKY